MTQPDRPGPRLRFGLFEADLHAGELFRRGRRVHLQRQPFLLLASLLERPGELVERDELRRRLWPEDTFVDFDHGLATAVKKVRFALGDAARNPMFIETVGGRGYRFIAPVVPAEPSAEPDAVVSEPGSASASAHSPPAPPGAAALRRWAPLALVAVAAVSWAWWRDARAPTVSTPLARLNLVVPASAHEHLVDVRNPGAALVLSPDGERVVYALRTRDRAQLFTRALAELDARAIAGTVGGSQAFFSPDGRWLGFHADGKLKKAPSSGGAAVVLADAPQMRGASWSEDGAILFAPRGEGGLWRVAAAGGEPVEATRLDPRRGEVSHRWPQILPGGAAAIFATMTSARTEEERGIEALTLATGERRTVLRGVGFARYVETGHLLYTRAGDLFAAPFDARALRVVGPELSLGEPVEMDTAGQGRAYFDVSRTGTLAYVRRQETVAELVWVDRNGRTEPASSARRAFAGIELSPDGRWVAATLDDDREAIWIGDLEHDTWSLFTAGTAPFWFAEGPRLAWSSGVDLYAAPPDHTAAPTSLAVATTVAPATHWPYAPSPDGALLAYSPEDPESGLDLWVLDLDRGRSRRPLLRTPRAESSVSFSPDARFFVHQSRVSLAEACEVHVRTYPGAEGLWQDEGWQPEWSRDGSEIFYRRGDALFALPVETSTRFRPDTPRLVFAAPFAWRNVPASYGVAPGGQRFLAISVVGGRSGQVVVAPHWLDELRARYAGRSSS